MDRICGMTLPFYHTLTGQQTSRNRILPVLTLQVGGHGKVKYVPLKTTSFEHITYAK